MGRFCIVLIFLLSFISAGLGQSSMDMVAKTVFRQVDWDGNYVWKDIQGVVILKELVQHAENGDESVYVNSDQPTSHANSRQVQILKRYIESNQFVYSLHRNGFILVEDLYGNTLGRYMKDSNENLVFQKNPRRQRFVSTQGVIF